MFLWFRKRPGAEKLCLMVAGVILNRRHLNDKVLVVYAFLGFVASLGRE